MLFLPEYHNPGILIGAVRFVQLSENTNHVYHNGIQEFQIELAIQPSSSLQYTPFLKKITEKSQKIFLYTNSGY